MTDSLKDWIRNLPSTNYKAFISIWLSVTVVMIFTVSIALEVELQTEAVYAVFIFLGGLVGADVTQFVMKRKTEIVTPPQVTAEHAIPTTLAAVSALPDPAAVPRAPAPASAASVISIGNQLAAETQAKAARQAGTAFEEG